MNQTDQLPEFNLDRKSRSGLAGFETFNDNDTEFFFHFNDTKGDVLVFSPHFNSQENMDLGIRTLTNNAKKESRFKFFQDTNGEHYFFVASGSDNPIARSKNFKDEIDMAAAKFYFQENLYASTETKYETSETFNTDEEKNLTAIEKTKKGFYVGKSKTIEYQDFKEEFDAITLRKSFRIDIYPAQNGMITNGKITYLLDGEERSFGDFNDLVIRQFIESKISPKERIVLNTESKNQKEKYIAEKPDIVYSEVRLPKDLELTNPITTGTNNSEIKKSRLEIVSKLVNGKIAAKNVLDINLIPNNDEWLNCSRNESCQINVFIYNFETKTQSSIVTQSGFLDSNSLAIPIQIRPKLLPIGKIKLFVEAILLPTDGITFKPKKIISSINLDIE